MGIGRRDPPAHAQRARALALDLQVEGVRAEPEADAASGSHGPPSGCGQRLDRGVEQQLGDGFHHAADRRGRCGGPEQLERAEAQGGRYRAHAVFAHGRQHLSQRSHAFATGAARPAQMLLDPPLSGLVEPLLEEVQRDTRVEVSVPVPIPVQKGPPVRRPAAW